LRVRYIFMLCAIVLLWLLFDQIYEIQNSSNFLKANRILEIGQKVKSIKAITIDSLTIDNTGKASVLIFLSTNCNSCWNKANYFQEFYETIISDSITVIGFILRRSPKL